MGKFAFTGVALVLMGACATSAQPLPESGPSSYAVALKALGEEAARLAGTGEGEAVFLRYLATLLAGGRYEGATGAAYEFLKNFPSSPHVAQVLLWNADALFAMQQYRQAANNLTLLLDRSPESPLTFRARLRLADLAFLQDDAQAAKDDYHLLDTGESRPDWGPLLDYRLARCAEDLGEPGDWADAAQRGKSAAPDAIISALYAGLQPPQKAPSAGPGEFVMPPGPDFPDIPGEEFSEEIAIKPPPMTAKQESFKKSGRYSVQLGAFSKLLNADQMAESLRNKGYEVRIDVDAVNGRTLYKVRIGHFSTSEEAQVQANKLQTAERIYSFVVAL